MRHVAIEQHAGVPAIPEEVACAWWVSTETESVVLVDQLGRGTR